MVLSPHTLARARMRRHAFSNKKKYFVSELYVKYTRMLNFQNSCQDNSETSSEEDDDEGAGKLSKVRIY